MSTTKKFIYHVIRFERWFNLNFAWFFTNGRKNKC